MMKKLILAVAIVMLLGSSVQANLILNPGIEAGSGADADNWAEGAGITRQSGSVHSGSSAFNLNYNGGAATQDVYLTAGDYTLGGWGMHQLSWAGDVGTNIEAVGYGLVFISPAQFQWAYDEFDFTVATASTVTIRLSTAAPYYFNPAFADDISLTAVPEPATMALMSLGVVGMLIRRKRR